MDEHPNATRLREALDAFNRRDVDTLLTYWSDVPVFHHGGRNAMSGTYRGKDEFLGLLSKDFDRTGRTIRFEPLDLLADNGHGAAIFRATGERDGKPMETTVAYAVSFEADGRQKEGWFLVSDQQAWDEFYR